MMILIFGKKGSGKTTLAKKIVEPLKENLIIFDTNNEYKEFGAIISDIYKFHFAFKKKNFPIRYYNYNENEFFFYLTFVKGVSILIDELHLYSSSFVNSNKYLEQIIRLQRHKNINFIGVSQRVSEISRVLTSQADKIITFRQTEPKDLKTLEYFGFDPEKVRTLEQYKYIELDL